MSRPRVDVGIVCWNTRALTLTALERLLVGAPEVDVRVLVRDNGSTDGTAEAIRSVFPSVEVERGHNIGFAAGVNSLLARSDAPWFVTLNSDAWPEPGALGRLVATAVQQPRAAVVVPTLLRPDGSPEPSVHPLPSLHGAARSALGRSAPLPVAGPVGWGVGAALLLRRTAVDALGGLDDSLFMYGEDLDWSWRAHEAGWRVWYDPTAVVRHVGNASGAQRFGAAREQVAIANANQVVRRRLGPARGRAWQGLNAFGAARLGTRAALRGNSDLRRFWWRQVPAHLGRRP